MPRTKIKSRLHPNEHKPNFKREVNDIKSTLPPQLQSFKQKFSSGTGFVEYI